MSLSTPSASHCPRCGSALDPAASQNPCPRCLFSAAMAPTQPGGAAQTPSEPLSPAALAPHFPQLEILECLGRGGMGVVYKARQKALNRFVALKILAPERSTDPGFAERFTAEARTLASLNHPNIVTIHDFGESGGFYHLVMEYVDGVNLRQAMTAGRFTPEQALAIVPPVCEALQYAHDHGVVHRDIKPENLLLDQQGRVKVADFGIAKLLGSATAGGPGTAAADTVPADAPPAGAGGPDTLGASAAGTPQYMAPEQRARGPVDHRADIYSLGVVLYELLTGETPKTSLEAPSRKIQIDVRLDEVVLRALAVAPELRFPTATEFRTRVEALTAPATPAPIQPPPIQVNTPALHRSLVPWALTYQWWTGGLFLLAGIERLLWVSTDSLYVSWIFKRLLSGFFITGIFLLRSLARRKADQWLNSLETGGRQALNRQAALFFPLLAGVAWMGARPVFGLDSSIRFGLVCTHFGLAAFPWVLLMRASDPKPNRSLLRQLTTSFAIPVGLLAGVVITSLGGDTLRLLTQRISRVVHREPVVPGTWPAVALSILGPRSPREVPNNPVLQVLPAIPRVEGPGPTAFKDIVLERFTNQWATIDPSCSSFTPLRPEESLEVWTKRSDGYLESHNEHPTIFQHGESRSQLLTMVFQLPETFLLFKLPLIEELRPKLEGRTLRLPEGQPMTLFGLTNRDGSWLAGGLTFRRTLPEDRGPTMATVWLKQLPVSAGNEISLIGSTSVPPGHALRPRLGGSQLGQGSLHWRAYLFRESIHLDASLFWRPRHGLQGSSNFDSAPALKQLEALAANGPLRVTNGHPRTLFAVTNALGESYTLAIELLSAKDTDP
jgi:serine/threonine protein kinase